MKRFITPLLSLTLLLAACGDNTSEVGTGSGADAPLPLESDGDDGAEPMPVEPDGGIGDGAEPLPEELPSAELGDEQVVTDSEPQNGVVTNPTEVIVNPNDPSELWVRFIGGAIPCTAAEATVLTETPDEVVIELIVGLSEQAAYTTCVAGDFNLRVDVSLNEPAGDKAISWSPAEQDGPQQMTPDLTTDDFVGLTEAEAAALADENIITWRVSSIDGEPQMVTMDYSPSRLNFELEGGVVTAVTTG